MTACLSRYLGFLDTFLSHPKLVSSPLDQEGCPYHSPGPCEGPTDSAGASSSEFSGQFRASSTRPAGHLLEATPSFKARPFIKMRMPPSFSRTHFLPEPQELLDSSRWDLADTSGGFCMGLGHQRPLRGDWPYPYCLEQFFL